MLNRIQTVGMGDHSYSVVVMLENRWVFRCRLKCQQMALFKQSVVNCSRYKERLSWRLRQQLTVWRSKESCIVACMLEYRTVGWSELMCRCVVT